MAENQNILYAKLQFQKPQINISCPATGRMWLVSLCALIAILQSSLTDSFYSLVLAMSAVLAAILAEYLCVVQKGKTASLKDGSAVASALILTLLLPNRISPVYAIMGAIFAIGVVKHCFGGLGSNWLNPAAGGWLFIRLSWPGAFNKALEESSFSFLNETLSGEFYTQAGFLGNSLHPFLEKTFFALFKVNVPPSYLDLLSLQHPGIIADRGILGLLIGTIFIIALRASRSWITAVWLLVFVFLARMSGADGLWWKGDIFFFLCTGGTLAVAFLLAADPATNSKSNWCILGTAAAGGFFAWLFRFPGGEPYGAVFSVVLINALLPIVRSLENHWLYRNRRAS